MTTIADRKHLAELRREFGRYTGKDALIRELGDVFVVHRIARKTKALVRKRDMFTDQEDPRWRLALRQHFRYQVSG